MAILAIGSANIIGELENPSLLQVNTDLLVRAFTEAEMVA